MLFQAVFARSALPRTVIALGFVSLFMDVSSEMIHSLLPVFLVTSLGASAASVGLIEGIAEATAAISKVFSGTISDWIGKRRPLVLLGYGLAALTKPIFPLATTIPVVLLARFLDRIGKGIRGAPRDALIADVTPPELRGAAFGLRQSMDTVGAFAGPLLAMALMAATDNDFTFVFWIAVLPAFISVAFVVFGVREPEHEETPDPRGFPISRSQLRQLDRTYWTILVVAAVLTLARFSEAFLLLRAQDLGLGDAFVPMVLVVMNVVYAVSAYPLGRLADTLDRRRLLAFGIGILIMANLVLMAAGTVSVMLIGSALWGLHMGATQGLLTAFVADAAPRRLRGTAIGFYNLVTGVALLIASTIAGVLWTGIGPATTFLFGAGFATVALLILPFAVPKRR